MNGNKITTQLSYGGTARWAQRIASATLALAAFALFAGGIADTFRPTRAEEVQIGSVVGSGFVQITDGACSAANTANQPAYDAVNNVLDINVMPGANASNCMGVTVTTDNTLGYSMTIAGPATGNLTLAGQSIKQKDGTLETPTIFAGQTTGGAWGFAIPSGQIQSGNSGFDASYSVLPRDNTVNTAKYAPVPTSPTTLDTVSSISGTQSFDYDVFFATSAGMFAPTGTYTGTVTISAFGNAATPPPIMQDLTDTTVAEVCTDTRTMAMDARDGGSYWIRRVGDLCWMETNLAYAGGGDDTYGDTMPAITQGSTSADSTYTEARYFIPTGSNATSAPTEPSTSTNGTGQYGYLYNWCAAMANQPAACQNSATQPNQSANPGNGTVYNVCPVGWRLPTGNNNEMQAIVSALGWTSGAPTPLFTNGLFMYSGVWFNGSFSRQGSNGGYWSSTVNGATTAYSLYLTGANASSADSSSKQNGYAVRCVKEMPVAKTGADIQTVTAQNCPTTRTRVRDARDGATYWVRKITGTAAGGGDLCWMETNLAYAGGGTNTFGDVTPAITQGSTSADYTYTDERYFIPTGSNRTTGTTDPSTSANGTGQYGYLYNWCAALNGQPAACQGTATTQPNQSPNGGTSATQYNICPAGWRLPTGNNNEMQAIVSALGWTSGAPTPLFTNGLFMYSGGWSGGAFSNQGSGGYYWSSTVGSTTNAYSLNFSTSGVYPANTSGKRAGDAVRCVAP